jgi:hypothetical protein
VDEIADGIYRICTPFPGLPGGFSFSQFLVRDDEPLLFHTGPRGIAALTQEAIASVLDLEDLRFIGFSHFECDECGALPEFLRVAPHAVPVCGPINAMINGDCFDRPARVLADGETLSLGRHCSSLTPRTRPAWERHLLEGTRAPLWRPFTQGGADQSPLTSHGHPRAKRGLPKADGLLLAHEEWKIAPGSPCRGQPTTSPACTAARGTVTAAALLEALAESLDS